MKAKLFQNEICVKKSPVHGYGVFAKKNIKKGEIVEECYAILHEDRPTDYTFGGDGKTLLPIGYGCIYNHSDNPNARVVWDETNHCLIFEATRFIRKEEIFISYGKGWFDCRALQKKELPWWRKPLPPLIFLLTRGFVIVASCLLATQAMHILI